MNNQIISEFKKLIKQIQFDIDHASNQKERLTHMFRFQNIKKATKVIEQFPTEIKSSSQLKGIPGIGKGTLQRIDEILKTGKLKEINEDAINDTYLSYMDELEEVFGIGRKKAFELFTKYKVKSIQELKDLYAAGKISLPENIVKGLRYYGKAKENIPRNEMDKLNNYLQNVLMTIDPQLLGVICGSYRRLLPTSNDIDMMLVHPDVKTKHDILKKPFLSEFVKKLVNSGFIVDSLTGTDVNTKYMGLCQIDSEHPIRRIDIRYIPYESYYYALLYFTGPKDFNRKMRQLAIDMDYILNEYGLYDEKGKMFKVSSEKEIFSLLSMEYVSPEFRK